MAHLKYENIWKLIKKYKFKIDFDECKDLMCVICCNVVQNACQSQCGCRYCYWCIDLYLRGTDKCCPGDMEDCKDQKINLESDIVFDLIANKRVSLIKVECPENYCQYKDELRNMEKHMETHLLKCPFSSMGCDIRYKNMDEVNNHLNNESHTNYFVESIQNLQNEINSIKENENTKDQIIGEIKTEMKQITEKLNNLEILFQEDSCKKQILIDDLIKTLTYKDKNEEYLEKRILRLENMFGNFGGVLAIPPYYNHIVNAEQSLVNNLSIPLFFAPFDWKIENFDEKRNEAKNNKYSFIDSEPFYSHLEGYKMILRIYPDGDEDAGDSYISVECGIIAGEFDGNLPWPMKRKVQIAYWDEECDRSHRIWDFSFRCTPQESKCAFYKPSTRYGNPRKFFFGASKYISFDELIYDSAYKKNGSILLKCFVH